MDIGIIGAGNVGGTLGKLWAGKGHTVVFGVRSPQDSKTRALLESSPGQRRAAGVREAAQSADVLVLATPWPATEEAVRAAGDLKGKVVIDCTNPLKADLSGLTLGHTTSAAEEVAQWARGARVVKAFDTLGAQNFSNPVFGSQSASMFICGDDAEAKSVVAGLARDLGFDVVDAGPLNNARLLEPLAMLWIYLAYKMGLGPTGHALKLLRR